MKLMLKPVQQLVNVSDISPNDYNPNRMDKVTFTKLTRGVKRLYDKTGKLPIIIVRPDHTNPGKYIIIDGEHRWRAVQELGFREIAVESWDVSESDARLYTSNLNYLKGEADLALYYENIKQITQLGELSLEELSEYTPEDYATLDEHLELLRDFDSLDSDDEPPLYEEEETVPETAEISLRVCAPVARAFFQVLNDRKAELKHSYKGGLYSLEEQALSSILEDAGKKL